MDDAYQALADQVLHCSYAMWLLNRIVRMAHPYDVYTCYRVTFILALLLGIVPYKVTTSSDGRGRLTPSYFGYLNMIARMCLYFGNFLYCLIDPETLRTNFFPSDIANVIDGLQKINGMIGVFTILVFSFVKRRNILKLFAVFDGLERESFPRVGVALHQLPAARKMNTMVLFLTGTMATYICCSFVLINLRDAAKFSISLSISYFSPHIIVCAVCFLTTNLILKLRIYFCALNKVYVFIFFFFQ